jgi:hypothetical protein
VLSIPTTASGRDSVSPPSSWFSSADWLMPTVLPPSSGSCLNNTALVLEDVVLVVAMSSLRRVQAAACDVPGSFGVQQVNYFGMLAKLQEAECNSVPMMTHILLTCRLQSIPDVMLTVSSLRGTLVSARNVTLIADNDAVPDIATQESPSKPARCAVTTVQTGMLQCTVRARLAELRCVHQHLLHPSERATRCAPSISLPWLYTAALPRLAVQVPTSGHSVNHHQLTTGAAM